ncbi:MAG: PAS domain S-box protein [Gammaproteobacteria bacterium]|nr:PAS domain S-box protein [Gammaproteobacteria bacterium]
MAQVKQKVRVGIFDNKPMCYYDKSGSPAGIFVAVIEYAAAQENWDLVYVKDSFSALRKKLEKGEIDLLLSTAVSEQRKKLYAYNAIDVFNNWAEVYTQQNTPIHSLLDLKEKRIATLNKGIFSTGPEGIMSLDEKFALKNQFVIVENYKSAMLAVKEGKVDAAVVNRLVGAVYGAKFQLQKSAIVFAPVKVRFAFNKTSLKTPLLIEALDKHMKMLIQDNNSIYHQAVNEAIGGVGPITGMRKWLLKAFMIVVIISLIFVVFIVILRKQVREQTRTIKKANDDLKAREKELNVLIDTIPLMVFVKEIKNLSFVRFNQAGEQLLGVNREQLLGKNDYDFFPKAQADFFTKNDRAVLASGKIKDIAQEPIETPNGKKLLHTRKVAIHDEHGNPVYLLGISEDITEKIAVEDQLRKSEQRFRDISESTNDWVWEIDTEGKYTFVTEDSNNLLGYKVEEIIGKTPYDFMLPDEAKRVAEIFSDIIINRRAFTNIENINLSKEGREVIFETSGKPIFDDNGQLLGYRGTDRDVTQRKQAERKLDEYSKQLEQLVNERTESLQRAESIAHVGSWHYNFKTNILSWSDETYKIFGIPKDQEPSFDTFMSKIHKEDLANVIEAWNLALKGEPYNIHHRIITVDGIKWVLGKAELNFDDKYKPVTAHGAIQDITENINRENALTEAKLEAESLSNTKSIFLANMSHEIRTPMNAIMGMTHLALQTELDEKQKNYITKANHSAENLLGIINDILDFSKIEAGKLELEEIGFSIKQVIEHTINVIHLKAQENGVQLSVHVEKNIPESLIGDPLRIGQILVNLASNAIKFSHSGGTVTLNVRLKEELEQNVILYFSVQDKGLGMLPEQQNSLFDAFTQADTSTTRQYGGTGLGLTISKSIIQLMAGEIWVDSEKDIGSTFHFTIKLKKHGKDFKIDNTFDSVADNYQNAIKQLKGAKILLVEDNEINLELGIELLKMNGMSVETAINGKEALTCLKKQNFDGVLMDCMMPVMDGYDATRQIRNQVEYKDLPIIAMTANAMKTDIEKVLAIGMNDHIAKPIKPEVMLVTMAKWIKPNLSNSDN